MPRPLRKLLTLALAAGSAGALAACSGDSGPPPVGAIVLLNAPATGQVGAPLTVLVRVDDESGNPIHGVTVTFSVVSGAGSVSAPESETVSDGTASVVWTLGTTAGQQSLRAAAGGQSATAMVQAEAGPPFRLSLVSGGDQVGTVGAPLAQAIRVGLEDRYGNGVSGQPIRFQPATGAGSASPTSATTDSQGRASTTWTLGTTPGAQLLEARFGTLPAATVGATAEPGAPAALEAVSGDEQTGTVNAPLAQLLVVRVLDPYRNPVPGASVSFAPQAGAGSASPAAASTDVQGRASTTWTLGTAAGTQSLSVSAGNADPVAFQARADPGPPADVSIVSGDGQQGFAGGVLAEPAVVRVADEFGNPTPDAVVSFQVTEGGGSTDPSSLATDAQGVSSTSWTLGPSVGTNRMEAGVADLEPARFSATANSGPPAELQALSGDGQSGPVGTELPDPVAVRVLDEFGNAVQGATVQFVVTGGGGSVSPGARASDAAGQASTAWTLGTVPGTNNLEARVSGVDPPAGFTATAIVGAAADLAKVSGDNQGATAGSTLANPLVVRVTDSYGNPVAGETVSWVVTQGGGSPDAATSISDADGLARVGYTAGTSSGAEKIAARLGGAAEVVFTVLVGNNLTIAGMYLSQSAQAFDNSVPLVAGRDGFLRVFALAEAANGYAPQVRVRFYDGGSLLETHTLDASQGSVPTSVDEGSLSASWNLSVPGTLIQPGLRILADVDPDDAVAETDESDNAFPVSGSPQLQDVRVLSDFLVRFVPVYVQALGTTGNVTEANKASFLSDALAMMPLPAADADVRAPYTTDVANITTLEQWTQILAQIRTARIAEGTGRYYYGVIRQSAGSPYCGLGYLGDPTAIGLDSCGGGTAAHEWGHNWNRLHAPCGNPGNPDPNYPYAGASIGIWGVDVASRSLRDPGAWVDLMSYCTPEWISDYTFEGVLSFREAEADTRASSSAPRPSVILWGRITPGGLVLEPSFEAVTRPSLPDGDGPYRITGRAADGRELFRLSFAGTEVDHAPGERTFAFAVPSETARPDELERLVLEGPGGAPAARTRSAALFRGEPDLEARGVGAGRVRVTWDPSQAPMVVVRDPATGAVLSLARGGSVVVRTDAPEIEVQLAGGVGSVRRRVRVR